jgi:hypothetical protein
LFEIAVRNNLISEQDKILHHNEELKTDDFKTFNLFMTQYGEVTSLLIKAVIIN